MLLAPTVNPNRLLGVLGQGEGDFSFAVGTIDT